MADREAEDPRLARFRKMSRPVRVVYARPRTFISIVLGIVAGAAGLAPTMWILVLAPLALLALVPRR